MKVLHVFDHSLPHHSGYAFRSESIVRALQARGIDTVHLTSAKHEHDGTATETVEGLTFHRCPRVITGGGPAGQLRCVTELRKVLKRLIRDVRPDVIHCHSPCLNGLAALGLGVPLVYEVRACWEDAAVSSGTTTPDSPRYRLSRALETLVARRADHLVVICDGLREEFVGRGIPGDRITVVGNAVNVESMPRADAQRAAALRADLGLVGRKVVGFFGSFYDYEGLELLVEALPRLLESVPDAVLVLAGSGEAEDGIRAEVSRLGLEEHVKLVGRVPHERIGDYYAMADVMAFPRLRQKLTDMVTPLKPLEAMYLRRPVVASDVGGHRELVRHEATGLLFQAGDASGLASALARVLGNGELAARLVENGSDYVASERLWSHMAERYEGLYSATLNGRALPATADR